MPAAIRRTDYLGTYASDELDARFVIDTTATGLVLRQRPDLVLPLVPVYPDDFRVENSGTLRFSRDRRGRVTGFSVYAGRVLDVRFTKVSEARR